MRFSTIALFVASAVAAPAVQLQERQSVLCLGGGNPQCCATDVLNLADLDCAPPPTSPTSINNFIDVCANAGQQAKCCLLPILGQALLCQDVNPTTPPATTPAAA